MTSLDLRVATLNIGGGEKTFDDFTESTQASRQKARELLIKQLEADVLCLQEGTQHMDVDGQTHSLMDVIERTDH